MSSAPAHKKDREQLQADSRTSNEHVSRTQGYLVVARTSHPQDTCSPHAQNLHPSSEVGCPKATQQHSKRCATKIKRLNLNDEKCPSSSPMSHAWARTAFMGAMNMASATSPPRIGTTCTVISLHIRA